ncbi:MAG: prepilin-type N-terminal cleavage/methylation domain-containing protein, partial [Acidimicrobiia bacterium]|nr:prepilin-type N-terminal cleavage/methylation domain-containing protein [Acidimicrobiia bacterium]
MRKIHLNQDGVSLTELLVAIFLLGVVSAVFLPTMISGMRATEQINSVARSNDNGRLALQRIDREMRAAEQ